MNHITTEVRVVRALCAAVVACVACISGCVAITNISSNEASIYKSQQKAGCTNQSL